MRCLPLIALIVVAPLATATTVYKTVDEYGRVSFSDQPPSIGQTADVLEIKASEPVAPEEYIAGLEAMREATDRLVADRQAREKQRAELRELQARTRSYDQPVQYNYIQQGSYVRGYRRTWRPPWTHLPEPPVVRPPLRPGLGGPYPGSNSQLMRPIVSTRGSNSQLMRPLVSSR